MKKINVKMFMSVMLAVIMLLNSVVAYAVDSDTPDTPSANWKDKIQPYLLEIMEETDEKIPVWLWFEDIDHDAVEAEVFARTGLTEDNLSVISEDLPEELAIEVAELGEADEEKQEEVLADFRSYLDRTSDERAIEAERTETYLAELNNVMRETLRTHNANIFKELDVDNEDVISADDHVPAYSVYLNRKEIKRLAANPLVSSIYYYEINAEVIEDSGTIDSDVMSEANIPLIRQKTGLTGNGVKLGIIERTSVKASNELPASRLVAVSPNVPDDTEEHPTDVARVAAGTNGVAPSAVVYYSSNCTDTDGNDRFIEPFNGLVNSNIHLINTSVGFTRQGSGNTGYSSIEKYVDYYSLYNKVFLVKSAGNLPDNDATIYSPGLAYNVLTVGGFNINNVNNPDDDEEYTNSYNHFNGCLKPDILAYMPMLGTSFATPFVTGLSALLLELRPSLEANPCLLKAILMASCHRKVKPYDGSQVPQMTNNGLMERQGAGAIDPYRAVAITGAGYYGYRVLNSTASSEDVYFNQPAYSATGMNVTLTWMKENINDSTAGSNINLKLSLYNGSTLLSESDITNSSAELVYVTPSNSNSYYKMRVARSTNCVTNKAIRYAYAFSLNNTRYEYNNETSGIVTGVYYLKNYYSNKYMTFSGSSITQTAFSGGKSQQWFINESSVSLVNNTTSKYLNSGSSLGNGYTQALLNSSSYLPITLQRNIGTVNGNSEYNSTFTFRGLTIGKALTIYNNSQSSGASVAWGSYSQTNNSEKWILERVAYRKGDVNLDGSITSTDSQLVQQYVINSVTFSNVQKYYADLNGDGNVTNADALIINQIIQGVL